VHPRLDGLVKAVRDVSGRAAEEVQKSVDSPEVRAAAAPSPPISITTNPTSSPVTRENMGKTDVLAADRVVVMQVKDKVANAKKGLDQALDGVLLAVDKAQKFAEKVDK
jgi:hypothetical protein